METERRRLAVTVALVGLVLLAGCGGALSGDGSDAGDASDVGDSDGGDAGDSGDDGGTTTDDQSADVDEAQLRADAQSAIAAVETYQVNATQEVVVEGPQSQTATVTERASIDRTERELRRNRTVRSQGREVVITQYVVDRTVYARSDVYVRQFSSEWIRTEVTENFSLVWRQQDVLGQLESVLDNASGVEVTGVETVDDRETYRTRVDISPAEFETVLFAVVGVDPDQADNVSVESVEYVYWLDAETARPVRTNATISFTATVAGRTVQRNVSTTARYGYEPVSVDLPDEASEAVNVSGQPPGRLAPARHVGPTATGAAGDEPTRTGSQAARPTVPSVSTPGSGPGPELGQG